MINGYYITKEAVKASKEPMCDNAIARNFAKRIKSFYLFFLASCIYSFILFEIIKSFEQPVTPYLVFADVFNNIFEFIPLQAEILPSLCTTGVQWFVSALFVVTPVLYALVYKFGENFTLVFAPLIAAFMFGFMWTNAGTLEVTGAVLGGGWFDGLPRAVGDMFLAGTIYSLSQRLSKVSITRRGYFVMRFVRALLLLGVAAFCFMVPQTSPRYRDFVFIPVVFAYLILLMAFPKNSNVFALPFFAELGKISTVLFMVHARTGILINELWPNGNYVVRMICYYGISILVAFMLYHVVDFVRSKRLFYLFSLDGHKNRLTNNKLKVYIKCRELG